VTGKKVRDKKCRALKRSSATVRFGSRRDSWCVRCRLTDDDQRFSRCGKLTSGFMEPSRIARSARMPFDNSVLLTRRFRHLIDS
jgi:hypothetical protein